MPKRPRTIYLIKRLETHIRIKLEAGLQDLALTPGQYTTMSVILGGPISSASLARRVGITPQSMSEVIATLERKELVARSLRDDNRRIADLTLTAAGTALLHSAELRVDALEQELFDGLAEDQIDSLRLALEAVLN